jgi:Ca2+-binding EF-hand superfamily protein
MATRFYEKIDQWVSDVLNQTKNIATEIELREQSKVALNLFIEADIDGSESLSFEELKNLCDMAGLPMENSEEDALIQMDKDDSGTLDIEEWVLWWLNRVSTLPNPVKQQEAIARNTFKKFDSDGSGCLDASELGGLTQSLGADFTEEELAEALAEVDSDGSGVIEVEEFVVWWTQRAAANRSNSSLISLKMRKLAMKAAQVFSTDIFAAAWAGDLDLVKAFLTGEPRLAQAADASEHGEGWTALHYAAYRGHAEMVDALLESKADANRGNDLGFSALFYAAQRGHIGICRALLERGADPSVTGMCGLPQPLGQDGPPSAGGESADPAALEVFMCPVEHCVDYPQLRDLFQSMSAKCNLPQVLDYDKIRADLQLSAGTLSLELQQPQKAISQLPVKHWDAKLRLDMQMDTELVAADVYADIVASGLTLSMTIPAAHPKQPQSFPAVALDRAWVKKVQFLCSLHKLKRLQLLQATPEALRGAWVEFCACYATIDPQYRPALNVPDFMYLLIKKCPDKKNTKDLRHSLRASIEQVTIRHTPAPVAPSAEATGAQKGSTGKNTAGARSTGTTSTDKAANPNAVDVKDPIALVNAAISELFVRRAAAESAAAALAEQLRREQQEQEAKRKQGDADGKEDEPELLVMPSSKTNKAAFSKSKAAGDGAQTAGAASGGASGGDAQGERGAGKEKEKGWAWAEDSRVGHPTVSLQVAAVSPWGAGDYSSTVNVAILTTRRTR